MYFALCLRLVETCALMSTFSSLLCFPANQISTYVDGEICYNFPNFWKKFCVFEKHARVPILLATTVSVQTNNRWVNAH